MTPEDALTKCIQVLSLPSCDKLTHHEELVDYDPAGSTYNVEPHQWWVDVQAALAQLRTPPPEEQQNEPDHRPETFDGVKPRESVRPQPLDDSSSRARAAAPGPEAPQPGLTPYAECNVALDEFEKLPLIRCEHHGKYGGIETYVTRSDAQHVLLHLRHRLRPSSVPAAPATPEEPR